MPAFRDYATLTSILFSRQQALGLSGFSPTVSHWRRFVKWAAEFISSEESLRAVDGLLTADVCPCPEDQGQCQDTDCTWSMLHIRHVAAHSHFCVCTRASRSDHVSPKGQHANAVLSAPAGDRYTHMHYDRLTLHAHPRRDKSTRVDFVGPNRPAELGVHLPLTERFPSSPPILDYSATVCHGDCAVVDAAARVFALHRGWVTLLLVDGPGQAHQAKSMLCNTKLLTGVWLRTVVVSPDLETVEELFEWNSAVNVVHLVLSEGGHWAGDSVSALSVHKLSITRQILQRGISVMLAEPGCVWTSDPLAAIPLASAWDIAAAWGGSQYSLGLAFFKPTVQACHCLEAVERIVADQLAQGYAGDASAEWSAAASVFTDYVRFYPAGIVVLDLDPDVHVSSIWYEERTTNVPHTTARSRFCASQCVLPISICASGHQINSSQVLDRMQLFGHSYISEDSSICSVKSIVDVQESVSKWTRRWSLIINESCGDACFSPSINTPFVFSRSLAESSVVYSFGDFEDLSFELWLAARYGSFIYLFGTDPSSVEQYLAVVDILEHGKTRRLIKTPDSLDANHFTELIRQAGIRSDQLIFHSFWSSRGSMSRMNQTSSLKNMIGKLAHDRIELLKICTTMTRELEEQVFLMQPKYVITDRDLSATSSLSPYRIVGTGHHGSITRMLRRFVGVRAWYFFGANTTDSLSLLLRIGQFILESCVADGVACRLFL